MKPVSGLSFLRIAVFIAVSAGVLAGCGQRGPLYLPTKPQPVPATTTPVPTAPLPQGGSNTDKSTSPVSS